jgi:acid-sensing ion channel, other
MKRSKTPVSQMFFKSFLVFIFLIRMSELATIMKVCDIDITYRYDKRLEAATVSGDYVVETLKQLAPTFEDTFVACGFGGGPVNFENCREMFTEIITQDGVCYTFNMLNATEIYRSDQTINYGPSHDWVSNNWSLEEGYGVELKSDLYPKNIRGAGPSNGLNVYLSLDKQDLDYECRALNVGFKVCLFCLNQN